MLSICPRLSRALRLGVTLAVTLFSFGTQANELAPLVGTYHTDNLPGITINTGLLGRPGLSVNPTWTGTLSQQAASIAPIPFTCGDLSSGINDIISCLLVTDNYLGTGTPVSGARAAITGVMNVLSAQAQTGTVFKQYIGGNFAGQGLAGDGSVVTTTTATCDPHSCAHGTVIPVAATTQINGIYSWTLNVGDKVAITLDPGGSGIGPNNYFLTSIAAIDGLNVTIHPGLPSKATHGTTFYDLTPAASVWGIAATCQNDPNGNINPHDPVSNLFGCDGAEFDAGSTTQKVWARFGVLVSGIGNQLGVGVDGAFVVGAQTQPFQVGLLFSTISGKAPVTATGALIQSQGAFPVGSLIDLSSIQSCSANDISMPGFKVDCGGNATLSGSLTVKAAIADQSDSVQSTGAAFTIGNTNSRVILDGVDPTYTLTMAPAPADGQQLLLECGTAVPRLTVSANAGQTMKGTANSCSNTQGHSWHYRAANASWYMDY